MLTWKTYGLKKRTKSEISPKRHSISPTTSNTLNTDNIELDDDWRRKTISDPDTNVNKRRSFMAKIRNVFVSRQPEQNFEETATIITEPIPFEQKRKRRMSIKKKKTRNVEGIPLSEMLGNDPLLNAVAKGDLKTVEKMLTDSPFDIKKRTKIEKASLLHLAAMHNDTEMIKLLLSKNAQLEDKTKIASTPLHLAASKGCREAVSLLLSKGANINARDAFGYSPFHLCMRTGHLQLAEDFLLYGVDINFKKFDGKTALHMACELQQVKVVQWLLQNGIIVNAKDEKGNTALFSLIRNPVDENTKKILKLLGNCKDCSFVEKNNAGKNILHLIVEMEHADMLDLLFREKPDIIMKNLVNDKDKQLHQTPLHYACNFKSLAMVSKLLIMGGDPNIQDMNGDTAMHLAIKNREWRCTRELGVNPRTNLDIKNNAKKTPRNLLKSCNRILLKEIDYHRKVTERSLKGLK